MNTITSSINNFKKTAGLDIRAELFFDSLLKAGIPDDDVNIKNNGLFYRRYSKDVLSAAADVNDSDIINIALSRDGIYDIMPESLTHNYRVNDEREDPVEEFKQRKREEKQARHFYNPLENELFRFRYDIEKYEADFFSSLNIGGVADIIRVILGIEDIIPDKLAVKLFYAFIKQKSSGNQEIYHISKILESILNEKVTYRTTNIKLDHVYDIESGHEDMIMGINTTLESSENIFLKKYDFTIGPLEDPDNLPYYFNGQVLEAFVNTFFNLFIPLQSQFSFIISLTAEDELFSMDDTLYKSRLGISTVL
jgi:hypothetical protein